MVFHYHGAEMFEYFFLRQDLISLSDQLKVLFWIIMSTVPKNYEKLLTCQKASIIENDISFQIELNYNFDETLFFQEFTHF